MTQQKRVLWTKAETRQVAAAVFRQFKAAAGDQLKAGDPLKGGPRLVTVEDVEDAQVVAISDRSRRKTAISPLVLAVVSSLVREIAKDATMPAIGGHGHRQANEVIVKAQTTIDMQIRSLVRAELASHQPTLLGRVEELLRAHEHRIGAMLLESEQRLMEFWGGAGPAKDETEEKSKLGGRRPVKLRVLVACLRADQHHLIRDRLEDVADRVDVVILSQDDSLVGVRNLYYDKVVLLTKFIGHTCANKVQSIFPKDKISFCNGAALTAAATIREFLKLQEPSE